MHVLNEAAESGLEKELLGGSLTLDSTSYSVRLWKPCISSFSISWHLTQGLPGATTYSLLTHQGCHNGTQGSPHLDLACLFETAPSVVELLEGKWFSGCCDKHITVLWYHLIRARMGWEDSGFGRGKKCWEEKRASLLSPSSLRWLKACKSTLLELDQGVPKARGPGAQRPPWEAREGRPGRWRGVRRRHDIAWGPGSIHHHSPDLLQRLSVWWRLLQEKET